jgi:hypothetical protein
MNTHTTQTFVITVVASFIIGLGVGWLAFQNREQEIAPDGAPSEILKESSPQDSSVSINSLVVANQTAGGTVVVSSVSLMKDGWVVIHEDRDGEPGNILGAQRFTAGLHTEGGEVDLLRWTETGLIYYAMLHRDDANRAFDHTHDLPILNEQGDVVLVKFTAL